MIRKFRFNLVLPLRRSNNHTNLQKRREKTFSAAIKEHQPKCLCSERSSRRLSVCEVVSRVDCTDKTRLLTWCFCPAKPMTPFFVAGMSLRIN